MKYLNINFLLNNKNKFFIFSVFCIIAITILGYYDTVSSYFLSDDFVLIGFPVDSWRGPVDWDEFKAVALTFFRSVFLGNSLYLFGTNPVGYHVVNMGIHIINAILIFFLVFLITNKKYLSFLTSTIFAIHPIHSETVIWFSAFSYLFSLNFYLFSLLFFVLYLSYRKLYFYFFSLFVFIIALLFKSFALTLPFVIIIYVFLFNKSNSIKKNNYIKNVHMVIPYFAIFSLFLALTPYSEFISYGSILNGQPLFFWDIQKIGFIKTLLIYIFRILIVPNKLLIFPINEYVFKGYSVVIKGFIFFILGGPIIIFSLLDFKKFFNRITIFGILIIFINYIPFSFLLNDNLDYSGEARYFYFSAIGFSIIIANIFVTFFPKKNLFKKSGYSLVIISIIVSYVFLLKANNSAWIEASEVSYQIPHQTKKLFPLLHKSSEKFYFSSVYEDELKDGLNHHKGIATYKSFGRINTAFYLEYGFPVKVCKVDIEQFKRDKINFGKIGDVAKNMLDDFDLRNINANMHILIWDRKRKCVKDVTSKVKTHIEEKFEKYYLDFCKKRKTIASNKNNRKRFFEKPADVFLKKTEDLYYKMPIPIPFLFIDSLNIKTKVRKGILNGKISFIAENGDVISYIFSLLGNGKVKNYNIPIQVSELDSLDKRIEKVRISSFQGKKMVLCDISVSIYKPGFLKLD